MNNKLSSLLKKDTESGAASLKKKKKQEEGKWSNEVTVKKISFYDSQKKKNCIRELVFKYHSCIFLTQNNSIFIIFLT